MKLYGKAYFRMIFLFAVLTCSGIIVYSNYQIRPFNLEVSAGTNNFENRFTSEINTSDDDQIHYYNEVSSISGFRSSVSIPQGCSLIHHFSCPVWQPPKIS